MGSSDRDCEAIPREYVAASRKEIFTMSTLERAIVIAAEGHAGQVDKAGAPYVLHPLRLMLRMPTPDARIVAVLHDVCEDCAGWDFERLRREGFSETVITALDSVTKREGEPYEDFVRRAAADPIGRAVKLADMEDNSDLSRIAAPTQRDFDRIQRYRQAVALIGRLPAPLPGP
jgi:(p)ppGpp synthase/HD superfamily hydrolase